MTLKEVKQLAADELRDEVRTQAYIEQIRQAQKARPQGADVPITLEFIPAVERLCDAKGIPVTYTVEGCLTTAATYRQLYAFEQRR